MVVVGGMWSSAECQRPSQVRGAAGMGCWGLSGLRRHPSGRRLGVRCESFLSFFFF